MPARSRAESARFQPSRPSAQKRYRPAPSHGTGHLLTLTHNHMTQRSLCRVHGARARCRGNEVYRVDTERVDVRREPLVVRDGCAPERIPAGRWPSDEALVRSEQFAVNEAIACLAAAGHAGGGEEDGESRDWVFGVHAPPGTGVAEVFGDLVAAIVTERARRIADLADPAAAFGETRAWGAHTVSEPAPELAGFEVVLTAPAAGDGLIRSGLGLPPIGSVWRDR